MAPLERKAYCAERVGEPEAAYRRMTLAFDAGLAVGGGRIAAVS
jgi:hypothetical protein